jgi:hypothetical protein
MGGFFNLYQILNIEFVSESIDNIDPPFVINIPHSDKDVKSELFFVLEVMKGNTPKNYTSLKNIDINTQILLPYYSPILPTQQDYQIGEFRRCFCKKIDEIIYLEIDKDTYSKLIKKDPTIAFQYYQPFNIPWQLTGDKEQVFTTNRDITALTIKQQKLPQFDKYLKEDYIKYYK